MRKNITIFLSNNLIVYLFIYVFKKLKNKTIILNTIINIKNFKIKISGGGDISKFYTLKGGAPPPSWYRLKGE